jgi:glucose/arabinose dehydrogenase
MKLFFAVLLLWSALAAPLFAQTVNDPNLTVETVVTGLNNPTTMAFIGDEDFLILQKEDGKVFRVQNGTAAEVLDLNVDNASEHGLLGIALHPSFNSNGFVYLYYTQTSANGDSNNAAVANRVDKFHWDGSALTAEPGNPILSLPVSPGPNHNGGIILFGPDEKLYVVNGDLNRNGKMQNFPNGADPDMTSGIYRLNDDGTAAAGNPFTGAMAKYYAYGVRNSFGMAFDPVTNKLWDTENGENFYDEINLVEPGFNSGWQSIMGPDSRNSNNAAQDLYVAPGSQYADPKFSWFDTVGPTAIVFLNSTQLGAQYQNDVFVGDINNANLYHFELNQARDDFVLSGNLADKVADTTAERNAVLFGTGFGSMFQGITDLKVGPDGFLYVVSYGDGAVYRIVPANPPLTINTTALPDAQVGLLYDEPLDISGGVDPYTIQAQPTKGAFPNGIAPSGTNLTGTPEVAKKFKFTLQVMDDDGATINKQFSIQVFGALSLSTQSLKNGKAGKNYKAILKATGGKGPYNWSLQSGPGWITLTPSGQLSGMPVAGNYNLDVQVTDSFNVTKQASLPLTIGN